MTTSWSDLPLPDRGVVVFDLDDTLYPEREFAYSGFRAVAEHVARETGKPVFERLVELFDSRRPDPLGIMLSEQGLQIAKQQLIEIYRTHRPALKLAPNVERLLDRLRAAGHSLGIISDGRSITQRNKLRALHLDRWLDAVVISEEFGSAKPDPRNYQFFERRFAGRPCIYVGNDVAKDFIAPNRLGWLTVGLIDTGHHIHEQPRHSTTAHALPQYWVERLA